MHEYSFRLSPLIGDRSRPLDEAALAAKLATIFSEFAGMHGKRGAKLPNKIRLLDDYWAACHGKHPEWELAIGSNSIQGDVDSNAARITHPDGTELEVVCERKPGTWDITGYTRHPNGRTARFLAYKAHRLLLQI